MYGYIYLTTNLINGKIYVGQKKSEVFLPQYKGSGKALRNAFDKYGRDNFSVRLLCPCFSKEELNEEERFLIDYFDCRVKNGKGYNISEGGDWGDISGGLTPDQYRAWNEHKSLAQKGKLFTEEHKRHISESTSGELNHCYGKRGSESHNYGKKYPNRKFSRICVACNKQFLSGSNQTKYCPECNAERHLPKNPNRVFTVICRNCGSGFQSYSNNPRQVCSICKNGGMHE